MKRRISGFSARTLRILRTCLGPAIPRQAWANASAYVWFLDAWFYQATDMAKKRKVPRPARQNSERTGAPKAVRPRSDNNRLTVFFTSVEAKFTEQPPAKPARPHQELENLAQHSRKKRLAWLQRPSLHIEIFAQVLLDEKVAELGGTIVGDKARQRVAERAQEVAAIAKELGWSDARLSMFKQIVVEYRREPTIENYSRVRRQFPEVEIQIGLFAGIDPLFSLEMEFQKQGIDPQLLAAILDGDEPSIDELCLQLIERLVLREKISKGEPGHIQKRSAAISDAMVNYLIVSILESFDWNDIECRIPASLVVLIRHQITGSKPDLHATYLSRKRLQNVALAVARELKPSEKLSINKLASIVDVPRSTAARWLKDKEFKDWLETGKKWVAEGLFKNLNR